MGKVFSLEEVVNGKVPKVESFNTIKNLLLKKLSQMPEVVSAAVCGSVLNGGVNIRSDIDAVIIYNRESQLRVIEEMQKTTAFVNQFHIPFSPIMIDDRLAKTPNHGIHRAFWEHLDFSRKYGGIVGTNPQTLLYSEEKAICTESLEYFSHKRSTLEKRWARLSPEGPERYVFLGKILSVPIYVARMVLRCLDSSVLKDGDGKKIVLARYSEMFKGKEVVNLLLRLYQADVSYTEALENHVRSHNFEKYSYATNRIELIVPDALKFILFNIEIVQKHQHKT